jgi:hypothetical protein
MSNHNVDDQQGGCVRKSIAVLLVSLCFFSTAAAQIVESYGLTFGMSGSRLMKTTTIPNSFGYLDSAPERSFNTSLGAFVRFNLIDPLVISTELSYVRKGGQRTMTILVTSAESPDGYATEYTFDIGLHYLELSLNLEPEFSIGNARMFGIAGLSMGTLIQSTGLPKRDIKSNAMGYAIGLGIHVGEVLRAPLSVSVKYGRDFAPAYTTVHGEFTNEIYHLGIAVSL